MYSNIFALLRRLKIGHNVSSNWLHRGHFPNGLMSFLESQPHFKFTQFTELYPDFFSELNFHSLW